MTTAVVLSRNYSTGLSVIRSLGPAGYTVDLVASAPEEGKSDFIAESRYVRNHVELVSDKLAKDADKALVEELLKYRDSGESDILLIPTDDFTASVADVNRDVLADVFVMPEIVGAKAGELTRLMNKSVQRDIAIEVGFPVADEWVISLREEEIVIPDDVTFPCFCKPTESISGFKTEMARCENREELEAHLKIVRERFSDRDFLVQEYLEIDKEIELDGLCIDQEIIVPAVSMNSIVAEHEKGVPVAGTLVRFDELGETKQKVIDFLKKFHYFGMFDMGILQVGDKIYFNELNLRSGGPNYAYFASGVNLPELFAKKALGQEITEEEKTVDRYNVNFFYEQVAWSDFFAGFLEEKLITDGIREADVTFIYNDDDPKPGEIYREENKLRRRRERCIRDTVAHTSWSREYAAERIKRARALTGIGYREYRKNAFYLVPEEKLEKKYEVFKAKLDASEPENKIINVIDKKDIPVVVLSRNYATGLSVIRSLGAAGYTVDLVANSLKRGGSDIAGCSKYVRHYEEVLSSKLADDSDMKLMDMLLRYEGKEEISPVLFPVDDYTASVVDNNRSRLEKIFVLPSVKGGTDGTMVHLMDKTVQAEMARKAGILTPREWIIALNDEIEIPEDMIFPCFCKPIESITGYKREMARCENREELQEHLEKLKGRLSERSVLVQEFLNIDDEIDLSGVCIDDRVIIPAIIRKTAVAQYEKGVTMAGKLVPFEELGELQEKTIRMLQMFGYTGMFDMEFNIVGDRIYFNEVNLRSGGPNYSYFGSGVNLPDVFVKAALGMQVGKGETRVAEYGKSFIYEKVAWEDYTYGYINKRTLNRIIREADITLLENEDDPKPGELFAEKSRTKAKKKRKNARLKNIMPYLRDMKSVALGYPQTKAKNQRNPEALYPRVLVAGRNYSSNLSIARSLGEAGYEVEVLRVYQSKPASNKKMKQIRADAYSKYIKGYYICVTHRKTKTLIRKLERIADEDHRMLLIPSDDLVAACIDEYYDTLKNHYVMQNVNDTEGAVVRLMSKRRQTEMARAAGLPVADSCLIKTINGRADIPDEVKYPCFVKPDISKDAFKNIMKKCDSREELLQHIEEVAERKDRTLLIEDYVDIAREISILGVSTREGVIGPAVFAAEKGGGEERRGVAVTGRILPYSQLQPLADKLVDFVASLGFEGLYDIDLVEDVNGKIYFVEVNMRFGASGYAFTKCGLNLPGMYADYMIKNKPLDMNCSAEKTGQIFVNEKELMDGFVNGRLTRKDIDEIMDEADITFIKNDDDPKAYRHFKRFYGPAAKERKAILKEKALENN